MNTIKIDNKTKSQLNIEYMNAVYAVSSAKHPAEYLYKVTQYKKAKHYKQLLEGHLNQHQCS
ncbi:hypothetical protein F7984_01475 [Pradoshia sp. D12]|jgi:hypothetical protein|uniref:hypothetical protein n=1 Tax=Bacillaceae TaxID=186817 RepID=UPI00080AF6A8|nr:MULTISPECIES: hypothetical protein [Bacillaceae]OCA80763.1 hypothetical protein A8L44_16495 [Bacillus sp. FJAT-27986]QFK70026.1 hypothetical protein F7984_01475 [Pradoshia sp. D12]TPF70586.1 hypothetical protein FHY44_16610 [Bacillus sp. D12]